MTQVRVPIFALALAACASSSGASRADGPAELPAELYTSARGSEVRITTDERGVSGKLEKSPDEVFRAVAAVYQELDLDPDVLDPRGRTVGASRLTRGAVAGQRPESLVRCANEGAGPSAASRMRVTFSIMTQVAPSGASASSVKTTVRASATPVGGSSIGRVVCISLGEIERIILGRVALSLGIEPG